MRRRDFLCGLGSAAAWPTIVRAKQTALPVIGLLNQESADLISHPLAGFHKGLSETGFASNRNVAVEYRWAEGHYDRLPQFASDLVNRNVAVIAAAYLPSAIAAK